MAPLAEPEIQFLVGVSSGQVRKAIFGSHARIGPLGPDCPSVFVLFVPAAHGSERHRVLDKVSSSFPFRSYLCCEMVFLKGMARCRVATLALLKVVGSGAAMKQAIAEIKKIVRPGLSALVPAEEYLNNP